MVKLRCVVLHETAQKLEVTVEDAAGRLRRVWITWLSKDPIPLPVDWMQQVEGELAEQDALARDKATGRVLF